MALGLGHFILLRAELGGEQELFSSLLRNQRSRIWNGPKLKYIIGLINATLEQSFPPRNSIRKVGCCVLLLQREVWWGCAPTQHFRQTQLEFQQSESKLQSR